MAYDTIPPYEPCETADDFHAVTTITLGELLTEGGIDWTQPEWSWRDDAYNDTQYTRCCKKIENRYYDRELGVMPPGRWRHPRQDWVPKEAAASAGRSADKPAL